MDANRGQVSHVTYDVHRINSAASIYMTVEKNRGQFVIFTPTFAFQCMDDNSNALEYSARSIMAIELAVRATHLLRAFIFNKRLVLDLRLFLPGCSLSVT